jgi:hypothetical protein
MPRASEAPLVFLPVLRGAWRRAAVTVAVLMVLAIGFSRVALGVHYVSDVVDGPVDVRQGLEPEQAPRLAGRTTDDEEIS